MAQSSEEAAWKIHAAISDWTGKVDQKASFALAIESALIVGIISLSDKGKVLASLDSWALWLYRIGLACLALSVLCSMRVVIPRLRSRKVAAEWRENFIYFGHLQHWTAAELADALQRNEILPILARQLIAMSKIAWMKHRFVQHSFVLAVVGSLLVSISGGLASGWLNQLLSLSHSFPG